MTTQAQLSARFKQLGIRLTPQRLAIAEVVVNSGDHPSVKQVYERVKEFFPYVTLATVYSTLAVLQRAAVVRELPFQRESRYDANLEPHANLVCIVCGTVVDAEVGQDIVADLQTLLENESQFEVAGQRVDFYGWCSGCARDRRAHADQTQN